VNIFHIRKTGVDTSNGLTKDDSVLTIAAGLALCSATDWNMLCFGPGTWNENFGVTAVPLILVGNNIPMTYDGSASSIIGGAADANPIITAQKGFKSYGVLFVSNEAGKPYIQLNVLDEFEIANCLFFLQGNNQVGIDLQKGISNIHDNIFFPYGVACTGSYYIKHTAEVGPNNIYANAFEWDSVLGLMAENRIVTDVIAGGSKSRYMNNIYADIDFATPTLRTIHIDRNVHPSTATIKDPDPGKALAWNKIVIPIQLYTRTVEDASIVTDKTETEAAITAAEVLLEGADSRDNTEVYNKITSLAGGPVVVIDVPEKLIRPVAGSTVYRIAMNIYDSEGNPEAPDVDPTIKITNRDETVIRVVEVGMNGMAVGQYYYDYTITSATVLEKESIIIKMIEGGITTYHREVTEIYDEGSSGSGSGSVIIDHDYGGVDNYQILRITTSAPIEGANLYMFTQADWNTGNRDLRSVHDGGNCRGQSTTGSDGRWLTPIALDPDTYIMFVSDPLGEYVDSPITIIVT